LAEIFSNRASLHKRRVQLSKINPRFHIIPPASFADFLFGSPLRRFDALLVGKMAIAGICSLAKEEAWQRM
jgi:hypothetical protein